MTRTIYDAFDTLDIPEDAGIVAYNPHEARYPGGLPNGAIRLSVDTTGTHAPCCSVLHIPALGRWPQVARDWVTHWWQCDPRGRLVKPAYIRAPIIRASTELLPIIRGALLGFTYDVWIDSVLPQKERTGECLIYRILHIPGDGRGYGKSVVYDESWGLYTGDLAARAISGIMSPEREYPPFSGIVTFMGSDGKLYSEEVVSPDGGVTWRS